MTASPRTKTAADFPVGSTVYVIDSFNDWPTVRRATVTGNAMRSHRATGAMVTRDDGFSELSMNANLRKSEPEAVAEAVRRLEDVSARKHREWSESVSKLETMRKRLGELETSNG